MLDNPVQKLKEENEFYEKQIENLKKESAKAKKYDELEAKYKYSEDTIETMKKNIQTFLYWTYCSCKHNSYISNSCCYNSFNR